MPDAPRLAFRNCRCRFGIDRHQTPSVTENTTRRDARAWFGFHSSV